MLLETKKLTYGYIKKPLLFAGVDLAMDSGVLFVTGMSGAGKSTFLKTLCDMEDMYLGEVLVCGKRPKESTDNITYLPDKPIFIYGKTVKYNMEFAAAAAGKVFDENNCDEWVKTRLNTKVKKLSILDKYLLALKRAEIKHAKLMLIDLSFDGLSDNEVSAYIQELGKLFKDKNRLFVVAVSAKNYKLLSKLSVDAKFMHIFMGKTNFYSNYAEFSAKIADSSMAEYTNFVRFNAEIESNENGYFLHVCNKTLKMEQKYLKGILSYFDVSSSAKVVIYANCNIENLTEKKLFEMLTNKNVMMFDEISYEILF